MAANSASWAPVKQEMLGQMSPLPLNNCVERIAAKTAREEPNLFEVKDQQFNRPAQPAGSR